MPRWPDLLTAAGLIILASAAANAQPAGKPAVAAIEAVEPARIIEAMEVCRQTESRQDALRRAREQGFEDLPREERARVPFETLVREGVRLIVQPPVSAGGAGSCTLSAPLDGHAHFDDVAAALAAHFGQPGKQGDGQSFSWETGGRHIAASLIADSLRIFVGFPDLPPAEAAAAREEARAQQAETMARLYAAAPPAPAADIAAAVVACVSAVGEGFDATALESAGWSNSGGRYRHRDNKATIFAIGGQCVVDAYAGRGDSFNEIRDAIRAALVERFGSEVRLSSAVGSGRTLSRGQGFVIGERIGVLSSERRPNGLSIRFTTMSM